MSRSSSTGVHGSMRVPTRPTVPGLPMTWAWFVGVVKTALSRAGLDSMGYSGHSFRIGAATTAAHVGVGDAPSKHLEGGRAEIHSEPKRTAGRHHEETSRRDPSSNGSSDSWGLGLGMNWMAEESPLDELYVNCIIFCCG